MAGREGCEGYDPLLIRSREDPGEGSAPVVADEVIPVERTPLRCSRTAPSVI